MPLTTRPPTASIVYEAHLQPNVGWWITAIEYDRDDVEITRALVHDEPHASQAAAWRSMDAATGRLRARGVAVQWRVARRHP